MKICDALRDLVPFVQFIKREKQEKREKHDLVPLYKWYQIAQRITYIQRKMIMQM